MANPHESELHYPFGDQVPEPGRVADIAPGVRWLRMGLPFALDHINLWLLEDRIDGVDGWTIVDCGITNDATREANTKAMSAPTPIAIAAAPVGLSDASRESASGRSIATSAAPRSAHSSVTACRTISLRLSERHA